MFDLSGKAILVTGSTRGIGLATAQCLLACGARVGIHGRDPAKAKAICDRLGADPEAIPLAGDFQDPEAAQSLVRSFLDQAGSIDGLVNNAGGGKAKAFRALSLATWRQTFSTNLESAFLASREAYLTMRKQKRGAIVNVASLAGHGPGKWMGADYAASKAGLVSLTQSLAFEAARFNVRVNAVSPGMVETDMTAPIPDDMRQSLGIPMGRLARPEEVGSAIAFLLSDDSAYMTGQVLHINGGLQM